MSDLSLQNSTISEFHEQNLMVYYDLCKMKQQEHIGFWIQKIDQIQIPEFDVKKETIQDRTILRNKKWGTKAKWRDEMKKTGFNKSNTKLFMVDHDELPIPLLNALEKLPIKHPVFSLNIQPPGGIVPAHEDTWRLWYDKHPELAKKYTFEDAAFFLVFITRQEKGHFFSADTTNINWEPGDVFEMPYYCNHSTANAGFTPKMLVQCLGIKI